MLVLEVLQVSFERGGLLVVEDVDGVAGFDAEAAKTITIIG